MSYMDKAAIVGLAALVVLGLAISLAFLNLWGV